MGTISKIIDGTFTPAGSLLLSSELGTVYKVEYAGPCVEIGPVSARPQAKAQAPAPFELRARGIEVRGEGLLRVSLHDGRGRFLEGREILRAGYHEYARLFRSLVPGERYFVRGSYSTDAGSVVRTASYTTF